MKEKSIELLNKAVADELAAVNQYMYFHFHCDDQGYDLLAKLFRKVSIDEMIHVEELAERILFLGGDVEMEPAAKVEKIKDVKAMLELSAKLEEQASEDYNKWANMASENNDSVTKKLFEKLVGEEEEHFEHFDDEIENLKKFGDNYLALQSIERSKNVGRGGE